MGCMNETLQWVIVIVILLFIFSRILRFLAGKKKNKQQVSSRDELLKRQTQNRLGRDARTEEQIVQQLKNTKDNKKRKELLKQAGKIANDEEIAAKKGL